MDKVTMGTRGMRGKKKQRRRKERRMWRVRWWGSLLTQLKKNGERKGGLK